MKTARRYSWLACLVLLCGCHLFRHANDAPSERADKEPAPDLPGKYNVRISQFVFLSDVDLRQDQPLAKDLGQHRETIYRELRLPASNTDIFVCLFQDQWHFEKYMKAKYPTLPSRRAFFVQQPRRLGGAEDLMVYTYWGERVQQDLRHELTHAILHSVLKDVPIWLDEGLAEYFEVPAGNHGLNPKHVEHLRQAGVRFDLDRLEQLKEINQMTPAEYREAWAWTHLMLRSTPRASRRCSPTCKSCGPIRRRDRCVRGWRRRSCRWTARCRRIWPISNANCRRSRGSSSAACGVAGSLATPQAAYNNVMRIFVTAGNTQTLIDRVRCITNVFTGRTGAAIALEGYRRGHHVTLATSHPEVVDQTPLDPTRWRCLPYRTFNDLDLIMSQQIGQGSLDAAIHCAAVGDYEVAGVFAPTPTTHFDADNLGWYDANESPALVDRSAGKVKSDEPEVWLRLVRAPKLVDKIRTEWSFRKLLVKFKLEVGVSEAELQTIAEKSRRQSAADWMVANTLEGASEWALLGNERGYRKVPRAELAASLLDALFSN